MSAQGTYRFYSVQRQTILLVNGEPLGQERVKRFSGVITPSLTNLQINVVNYLHECELQ